MGENRKKNYAVKLKSLENIEELLQETYDLSCQQYKQINDEINKIANTTVIKDLDIEGKEKYAKIMNNYIALQQKAIAQKFDIAKVMSEIQKHNGDVKGGLDDVAKQGPVSFDLDKLRKLAKDASSAASEETTEYSIGKKPKQGDK